MKKLTNIKRDLNIVQSFKREINLNTRIVRDRKKYTRKLKHKNQHLD